MASTSFQVLGVVIDVEFDGYEDDDGVRLFSFPRPTCRSFPTWYSVHRRWRVRITYPNSTARVEEAFDRIEEDLIPTD